MSRIRTIKPGFFKNDQLAELPALTRLLFIGLWTLADKEGRLEDRPKRIKAEIMPYDDIDIENELNELFAKDFIDRYDADGVRVIFIKTFLDHQLISSKEAQTISKLPARPQNQPRKKRGSVGDISGTVPEPTRDNSGANPESLERNGYKEGKGKDICEPGGSDLPQPSPDEISFENFQTWILEYAPEVARMKEPFTYEQFLKARDDIPPGDIRRLLQSMHNYAPLHKKNRSAYRTLLNWKRMDDERNPQAKSNESARTAADIQEQRSREILEQAKH